MLTLITTVFNKMRAKVCFLFLLFHVTKALTRTSGARDRASQVTNDLSSNDCRSSPEISFLFDWKSIVDPCKYSLSWLSRIDHEKALLMRTNARHTTMIAKNINVDGLMSSIVIQTYTGDGQKKTFGGDSWRGVLTGTNDQMVFVNDNMDGTYTIQFRIHENGRYKLEMVLEQSVCDGLRDPPPGWFEHGDMHGHFQSPKLLGPGNDYILEKVVFDVFEVNNMKKPITFKRNECHKEKTRRMAYSCRERSWVPEEMDSKTSNTYMKTGQFKNRSGCRLVWDSFGIWVNLKGEYIYFSESTSDSSNAAVGDQKFETLWIYGDSVSQRWWDSSFRKDVCKQLFKFCFHTYTFTYAERDFNKSHIDFGLPFNKSRFLDPIRIVLDDPHMKSQRSILVINFGIHLILSLNFTELRDTVDRFAQLIEKKRLAGEDAFPRVIWRTTTSTIPETRHLRNTFSARFLTNHRIRLFNAYANSRLCSVGIDILDVFAVTSSYPKACRDGVHFSQETFNYPNKAFEVFLKECMLKE